MQTNGGAGRIYWQGPDGVSERDRLPDMAIYRGHMADQLVGISNGGATTHAFGYKVGGPGSYGKDGTGVIGAAWQYQARVPRTPVLNAADSDGGGLQLIGPPPIDDAGNVSTTTFNPTGDDTQAVDAPVDGLYGRGSLPFPCGT